MTHLFIAISDRLAALPALKWVDADNGQLEDFEGQPSVAFPCALLDVSFPQCDDLTSTLQQCTANIRVRLLFDPVGEQTAAQNAASGRRSRSLAKYQLADGVYKTLQGFETEQFTPLTRLSQLPVTVNGYKGWDLLFQTTFDDETAVP